MHHSQPRSESLSGQCNISWRLRIIDISDTVDASKSVRVVVVLKGNEIR